MIFYDINYSILRKGREVIRQLTDKSFYFHLTNSAFFALKKYYTKYY